MPKAETATTDTEKQENTNQKKREDADIQVFISVCGPMFLFLCCVLSSFLPHFRDKKPRNTRQENTPVNNSKAYIGNH